MGSRPPLQRDMNGRSKDPLLTPDSLDSPRPSYDAYHRHPSFRSQVADDPSLSTTLAARNLRKKWIYASFFLALSLVSFVVQTETAYTVQRVLKWEKAYCMLWLTHSSWTLLWPTQLLILRVQKRQLSWRKFLRQHVAHLEQTAAMVITQSPNPNASSGRPIVPYAIKITAFVTSALTIAGGSWYVAIDLTTPSDLTAIYNCSAFFAYVFSVPILKERFRIDKSVSVAIAIVGVLVVAYGPAQLAKTPHHSGGATGPSTGTGDDAGGGKDTVEVKNRLAGNILIGIGSVLYGLYEVLYKKLACPPEGTSPGRSMIFANTVGSCIGAFTFLVLWIPIPILHFTGLEIFEIPPAHTAWLLLISVLANATFSGSFLVLMSLTSPVLSSVAALLTIFLVAITDWLLTGEPLSAAAIVGGLLIIIAFGMLSWSTYREMREESQRKSEADMLEGEDGEEEGLIGR